ncbi:MAG: hypothetical protein ACO1OX_15065 [Novosphingobium sp.]
MILTDHVQCAVLTDWFNDFSQCLYEWQGIEGGILALIAAYFSIRALRRQIEQAERHENERLDRQHNAVRATLPLTLSGLIENCQNMLTALNDAKRIDLDVDASTEVYLPPVPAAHISELQDVISSSRSDHLPAYIGKIIQEIQTLYAQVSTLNNRQERQRRVGLDRDIDIWILQAAKIHALVEGLFDYARYKVSKPPTSAAWERVESAIFQRGVESQALVEMVRQGLNESPTFWAIKAKRL